MTTHTPHAPDGKPWLKVEGAMPFATSLAIAGPSTFLTVILINKHVALPEPWLWMFGIFGIALVDFLAVVLLEPMRKKLGKLTIPALLSGVTLVLAYTLYTTVTRYVGDGSYEWLLPFTLAGLGICYCGVFREKSLALKSLLALNGLALTLLWCLAAIGKVALPF